MLYAGNSEKYRERSKTYYHSSTKRRREAIVEERAVLETQLYEYIQRNADLQAIFERLPQCIVILETPHGERLRAARKKEAPVSEGTAASSSAPEAAAEAEADELMLK